MPSNIELNTFAIGRDQENIDDDRPSEIPQKAWQEWFSGFGKTIGDALKELGVKNLQDVPSRVERTVKASMLAGFVALPGCASMGLDEGLVEVVGQTVMEEAGSYVKDMLTPESVISLAGGPAGVAAAEIMHIFREKDFAEGCEQFITDFEETLHRGGGEIVFKELDGSRYRYKLRPLTQEEMSQKEELENDMSIPKLSREEMLGFLEMAAEKGGAKEQALYFYFKNQENIGSLMDVGEALLAGDIKSALTHTTIGKLYDNTIGESLRDIIHLTPKEKATFQKYYDAQTYKHAVNDGTGKFFVLDKVRQEPPPGDGRGAFGDQY